MGKTDFFDELGKTITRTARELGERAEQIYEDQKIRTKITGEERVIEKIKADLGNVIFKRHENGEALDSELSGLCEDIQQHLLKIREYREEAAELKKQKICPSCDKAVDREVSFCPYCGAACPTPVKPDVVDDEEPEETEAAEECGSVEPEAAEEIQPEAEACGSAGPEEAAEQQVEDETEQSVEETEE